MATHSENKERVTVNTKMNENCESVDNIENVLHTVNNIFECVDIIKAKPTIEETPCTKSSSEILSELFGAFNATPPEISDSFPENCSGLNTGGPSTNGSRSSSPSVPLCNELAKKNKSSKKKHKHKRKKQKKDKDKDRKSSRKHRHREKCIDDNSSKTTLPESKLSSPIGLSVKISTDGSDERITEFRFPEVPSVEVDPPSLIGVGLQFVDAEARPSKESNNEVSVTNTTISDGQSSTKDVAKTGTAGNSKISIKNLKFSSVFEATMREVEEQAKAKADKYEEGEISNSSEEETTQKNEQELDDTVPVLSSSRGSSSKPKKSRCKRRNSESVDKKSRGDESVHEQPYEKRAKVSKSEKNDKIVRHSSRDRHHHSHHRKDKKRSRSKDDSKHSSKVENGHRSHSGDRLSRDRFKDDGKRENDKPRLSKERKLSENDKHSDRHRDRHVNGHKKGSFDRHTRLRTRSYSKSPSFDKQKLMEIARKNALQFLKQGAMPGMLGQDKMVSIKSGGKSVEELTNFCKRLSKKETAKSESENDEENSDSGTERPFNHPFQIKERPLSIVMNIRNAVQMPVKSLQEKTAEQSKILRVQFPVSSGQQHRKTESEWVPVEPKPVAPKSQPPSTSTIVEPKPVSPPRVFPSSPTGPSKDIGNIVTQRLRAMRKLQENPHDVQALSAMYNANQDMQTWAESKQLPGQFTGSTGVKVLSVAELSSGAQAYVKKDQLVTARPVSGGMGMSLLQKMGWRPGEGLGKNKGGSLEPLSLEIKMDKRGLVTQEDLKQYPHIVNKGGGNSNRSGGAIKKLNEKHPISVLIEFCARRRYNVPQFEMCHESGPDHKKNFLFSVRVNGVDYKPVVTSPNKKLAKAEAATVCLRALGVYSS